MNPVPNSRNKAPVGSRWTFTNDKTARVFVVTDRKPGGVVEYKQEGRCYFGSSYLPDFLKDAKCIDV